MFSDTQDEHYQHMLQATINSVLMVIGTELGDKTFFIAAVLGMRSPAIQVFLGAWGALAVMSVLSVIMGMVLPEIISFLEGYFNMTGEHGPNDVPLHHIISHYLSLSLFAYFGIQALLDAKTMYATGEGAGVSDELAEVEEELEEVTSPLKSKSSKSAVCAKTPEKEGNLPEGLTSRTTTKDTTTESTPVLASPNSTAPSTPEKRSAQKGGKETSTPPVSSSSTKSSDVVTSPGALAFIATVFSMTFTAEWGDKSQVATIAMGAARDPYGVSIGAILGHAFCTGLAVLGGKLLATSISERVTVLGSGILFLGFAVHGYLQGPEE